MNSSVNYLKKTVKSLVTENHNVENSSVFENYYLFYCCVLLNHCNYCSCYIYNLSYFFFLLILY